MNNKALGSMSVHSSSETDNWATPQEFFDKYNSIYNFTLDVCADEINAKCNEYFDTPDFWYVLVSIYQI